MSIDIRNNLILIGNGFDIHCGLKSSFDNFFNMEIINKCCFKKELENSGAKILTTDDLVGKLLPILVASINTENKNFLDENNKQKIFEWFQKNYFYIIFLYCGKYLNKINWSNVENTLKSYIIHSNKTGDDVLMQKLWDFFVKKRVAVNDETLYGLPYDLFFIKFKNKILAFREMYENEKKNGSWGSWLLKSLNYFEKNFFSYISLQQTTEKEYIKNCQTTFEKILKHVNNCSINDLASEKLYSINFNYTSPYCIKKGDSPQLEWEYKLEKKQRPFIEWSIQNITNVHGGGHDNSECILGIDDMKKEEEKNNDEEEDKLIKSYLFSKTFRRLKELFTSFSLPSTKKPINIIFYGLSLSTNDYSYYQSIFDRYDIYNNKTARLFFIYSTKYENFDNIYQLLHEYGNSYDNINKGENLITLLSLEQRLKIVNLDEIK